MKAKVGDYVKFNITTYGLTTLLYGCGRVVKVNKKSYTVKRDTLDVTFRIDFNNIVRIYKDRYKKPSNKRSK